MCGFPLPAWEPRPSSWRPRSRSGRGPRPPRPRATGRRPRPRRHVAQPSSLAALGLLGVREPGWDELLGKSPRPQERRRVPDARVHPGRLGEGHTSPKTSVLELSVVVGQQWGEPEGPERLLGRSCRCWSAGAEARERSFVVFGADEPVFGQAGARWGHSGSLVEDGLLARGRRGGGRRHRARGSRPGRASGPGGRLLRPGRGSQ